MITATEIFCLNELGKRANNEDAVSPRKGAATLGDRLFVVCDGVGGEKQGEVASEIVCRTLRDCITSQSTVAGREKEAVQKAVQQANENLAAYVSQNPAAKRMSTTLALVLLGEHSVVAAWCGDTRIHHIRNGKIRWRSKDHSLVSELVSQGELTEEEARRHPQRNVITRSLNALKFNNAVDYHEIGNLEAGDYLLLCSDGFLERMNDELICQVLTDTSQADKARTFLSYCEGQTRDNFSMYLVRTGLAMPAKRRGSFALLFWLALFVLLLAACLVLFVLNKAR